MTTFYILHFTSKVTSDPDPNQNDMDPKHCFSLCVHCNTKTKQNFADFIKKNYSWIFKKYFIEFG